jgi:hypothetical protein
MKKFARVAASTAALVACLNFASLATAIDAQAHPGPLPTWCPGDFWDPGWGNNWDWGGCHDNFRHDFGPGPGGFNGGPGGFDRGPDGFDQHRDGWGR